MALLPSLGARTVDYGARKLGSLFGLKPKADPNPQLQGQNLEDLRLSRLRKQNVAQRGATMAATKPQVSVGLPMDQVSGGRPNAPAPSPTRAVFRDTLLRQRGTIPTPEERKPAAPVGFQSVLPANDPAAIGGAAMEAQRQKWNQAEQKKLPEGWDAETYANFKRANPDLEPDEEETRIMLSAGQEKQRPDRDAALKQAYEAYISSLAPSTAEQDARRKYLDFVQSRDAGLQEIADKPIPMRFVTGQQESVQRLAGIEEQRRLGEIGLAQQAAGSAQEQARARLDFAEAMAERERQREADERAARKPIEVGGVLVDPVTFKPVYEPRAKDRTPITVGEGQTVIDPETGREIYRGAPKRTQPQFERVGDTLLRVNEDGTVDEVYTDPKSGATTAKPLTEAQAKNAGFAIRMKSATDIIDEFGDAAAGVKGAIQSIIPGGALTNFLRSPEYQRLDQAQRDFVNAILRRESGAAIAASEFDNAKRQYFPVAGDTPEVIAQKKANREAAIRGVQLGAGATDEVMIDASGAEYQKGEDGLYYPKAEGGAAAATDARRVANAIGQFESGGNYKALGPVLNSGSYKGDRAYGKYQVMGKNVPSWTKEALGVAMTPQQFLADPKAQDAVAEFRMKRLIGQGYGVEDIASIWFSGQPLAKAGNRKDQLGTSVPSYARNVRAIYERG